MNCERGHTKHNWPQLEGDILEKRGKIVAKNGQHGGRGSGGFKWL